MVASLSFHSIATVNPVYSGDHGRSNFLHSCGFKATGVSCRGQIPTNEPQINKVPEPDNVLLKIAWYGSELLGIAASAFRSPASPQIVTNFEVPIDCSERAVRVAVVDFIKQDFKRSYFVTGNLTPEVYEEKCQFADPAGSSKSLARLKRNCTNFGSLIEKSNMKFMKWERTLRDSQLIDETVFPHVREKKTLLFSYIAGVPSWVLQYKGVGHWKFSCVMSFPWKPILSATGYTEYYYGTKSGKICRHVKHWNVPKIALGKQLLRPSRGFSGVTKLAQFLH